MAIGKTIRILRVSRDLSLGKLARALRVSPGYLSLVEREKREPSVSFLNHVAEYFRVPLGFLFLGDADAKGLNKQQRLILEEIQRALFEYVLGRDGGGRRAKGLRRAVK